MYFIEDFTEQKYVNFIKQFGQFETKYGDGVQCLETSNLKSYTRLPNHI